VNRHGFALMPLLIVAAMAATAFMFGCMFGSMM
jgi:hypothetical protein